MDDLFETLAKATKPCNLQNVNDSCIVVNRKDASIAGSCNFCNRKHNIVNVVTGTSFIEVRFCDRCFSELRNYR